MAIAFVRSTQVGTSGGPTSTLGFNVASAAGNALILQVSTALSRDSGTGDPYLSVTSNISGTTFTRVASASIAQALPFYEHSQVWVATNVPAGTHVVTVNAGAGGADYGQLFLSEFSGVANVSVVDVTGTKTGDSTLGQFNTSITTASTNQAEELVIASFDAGGATDLSGYFSTGITTPAGFTSLGLDANARFGNRAYSQSYRIVNGVGPQTVSWGTIGDPGAGEKVVWAANVATLKAQVSGLVMPGTTLTAPASLLAGASVGIRLTTSVGQVLAVAGVLIAGVGVGRRNTTASGAIFLASGSFVSGTAVGISLNTIGNANFVASSSFLVGNQSGQSQSSVAGNTLSGVAALTSATALGKQAAQRNGLNLPSTATLLVGQGSSFNNASPNGVAFSVSTSISLQNKNFSFDSTNQPTFDADNGYTFDAGPVAASQSALPFGAVFSRQSSFVAGSVSSTRRGTGAGITLSVSGALLAGNPSTVAVGGIPGTTLVASVGFIAGSSTPQKNTTATATLNAASASIIAGSPSSTFNANVLGLILSGASSFAPGSLSGQTGRTVAGVVLSGQANIVPGVVVKADSVNVFGLALSAPSVLSAGSVITSQNSVGGSATLTNAASLLPGFISARQSSFVSGGLLTVQSSLAAGVTSAAKSTSSVGRLFVSATNFVAGGVNGLLNAQTNSYNLAATAAHAPSVASAIQAAQHPGQTFLIRPEMLAGQTASAVNATVASQTLNAASTFIAGSKVEFNAVVILSNNIAAQSNFLSGAAVGKQLTRRNTGGRAFYLLQEFLQPIVGQELIFSDQNGPRPSKPYATLLVRSIFEQNIIHHHLNANGIVSLAKLQRMIIEVQYFGLGAYSKAQILGLKLQSPSNVDRGDVFGISVSQIRGVTRVPELLNQSQYEERAILEFTAYIMVEGDDDVGLIEHAVIQDTDSDHACVFDFLYKGPN